ncbi:hypothetical protein EI42_04991 [Thermosporothrix hazakensis]|jgi:hypothetical protein|uniref:HAMP domain-containing protein n=2 Tax=Thermosporothrix TaxID=768650 RepID=A0A326U144_THEHA|nr:A24 family peptidase [Thermosporothrix hazakensis]PZW23608.1 hypothetical protein EI42_04991 [Thermosporothrix hazakensis]BBH86722.1 hypothetical protein KTC_14730 [Thermosporothrix sp. COM3]GCE51025.1 hypothetical protein KTH_58940 [Thermosporothrix hazakensis]
MDQKPDYFQMGVQPLVEPRKGFWGWWLNLTAPPRDELTTSSPFKRAELRKSELLGYCLFVIACFLCFDLILAFRNPLPSIPLVLSFVPILALVSWLNRANRTKIAGTIFISCIMIVVMCVITFVMSKRNGADLFAAYDFFVYPLLIGSLFLPRSMIFPFVILDIVFIIWHVCFGSVPPETHQLIESSGRFIIILRPSIVLFTVALVSWLGMATMERTLLRADRAEELIAARQVMAEQSMQLAEQHERLEAGIAQILHVHKEAAQGNYAVRAPVHSNDVIWQIGRSLNNLLARYERLARDSEELAQTRNEVEQISIYIEAMRRGKQVALPQCQTPLGKRLLFAFGSRPTRSSNPTMGD